MGVDAIERLSLAVAAARHGGGQATMAAKVRRSGPDAFGSVLGGLGTEQAIAVDGTADRLHNLGVQVVMLGEDCYPDQLARTRAAPAVLFVRGPTHLLKLPGIGVCGSRHASVEGLRAARACGEALSQQGFGVVSGYARGVDLAAHTGALAAGGNTVIVLPEGIERFSIRRGELADIWDASRVAVVSQFSPTQPWSAGGAMTRNALISGLSKALVVVEAGETGGTLAAGLQALARNQPVLALDLVDAPSGNQRLVDRGATQVRSRQDLEAKIKDLPADGSLQLTLV